MSEVWWIGFVEQKRFDRWMKEEVNSEIGDNNKKI